MLVENTSVKLIELPSSIHGLIVRVFDDEEYYTILVNSNLAPDEQLKTYHHELDHLLKDDFRSVLDINQIEEMRHSNGE